MRVLISALPIGLFTYLLSFIPLPAAISTQSIWTRVLSRLVVVGIVILGLLSGFGAVNSAWTFFPRLSRSQKYDLSPVIWLSVTLKRLLCRTCPTEQQITQAEQGLDRIRSDLAERRAALRRRQASQVVSSDALQLHSEEPTSII